MNSPEIKQYIKEHKSLFWHIPEDKKEDISENVLVEYILNYGDKEAVQKLFNLLGIKKVKNIFERAVKSRGRKKGNYQELTINYFMHLFKKYAH